MEARESVNHGKQGLWMVPRIPDFMQRVAILAAAAVPLVPRPTFGGLSATLSPAVVLVVGCCALIYVAARKSSKEVTRPQGNILVAAVAATAFYASRVVFEGQDAELEFVLSRVLMLVYVVSICLLATQSGARRFVHYFAISAILLSVLVLLIGMTGVAFLEKPYPARTLGISFPWFKTAGVPRSFGEQGIVLSMALAYLLVFKDKLRPRIQFMLFVACLIIFAMGQSRNMYIATVMVLVAWFVVVRPQRWRLMRPLLFVCAGATFFAEQLMPYFAETEIGAALIGEGIYERNVEARFNLVNGALELVSNSFGTALIGWQHADWQLVAPVETQVGVHNHFLASMLYLGLIAGSISIWAFFYRPLKVVSFQLEQGAKSDEDLRLAEWVVTAGCGVLVSLNFYEGFFSLSVAMFVGLAWFLSSQGSMVSTAQGSRKLG